MNEGGGKVIEKEKVAVRDSKATETIPVEKVSSDSTIAVMKDDSVMAVPKAEVGMAVEKIEIRPPMRNRRAWFATTPEGRTLRLTFDLQHRHVPIENVAKKPQWCQLCTSWLPGSEHMESEQEPIRAGAGDKKSVALHLPSRIRKGHRSQLRCEICRVPLCVRPHVKGQRSCFDLWHSPDGLEARAAAHPASPRSFRRARRPPAPKLKDTITLPATQES